MSKKKRGAKNTIVAAAVSEIKCHMFTAASSLNDKTTFDLRFSNSTFHTTKVLELPIKIRTPYPC